MKVKKTFDTSFILFPLNIFFESIFKKIIDQIFLQKTIQIIFIIYKSSDFYKYFLNFVKYQTKIVS